MKMRQMNNLKMRQFENLKMITIRILTIEVLRIFIACRTNQGSEALHHFAPKLIEAIPGNGLFIIAGCTFLFLFCASKKEKEKKEII